MVDAGARAGRVRTLPDLLRERARQEPRAPFLFFKDQVWDRAGLDAASDEAAAEFSRAGLSAGERVALLLPNGPDFIVRFFGALKAGLVAVPVNTALKEPEVAYILGNCGARALVTAGEGLKELKPSGDARTAPPPGAAGIIYTSGTTGFPKGAVLTHANYLWDVERFARAAKMTRDDRFLCFLPLFHVNGQVVTLLSPLWAGGSMVLMEKFQPKEFFELLSRHRCTAFSGVPSVYSVLLGLPEARRYDLGSLRFCVCGAAPMPVEVFNAFEARFKAHVMEGYGLSEATCASSLNPPPPGRRKIGSIGLPLEGQDMRVVDERGRELADGRTGEIVVRGGNVMSGYWNDPQATAQAIQDGWLRTGDMGYRDQDGYFFIAGRKKEMIIRGGENIYPKEIEEALYRHPAVAEAAVVGLPDARWGEEVAAFVVLKAGAAADGRELTRFLKDKIADFKLPRRFELVESLPKTATGKIRKRRLVELFTGGAPSGPGSP